jgi:hypothetical protein
MDTDMDLFEGSQRAIRASLDLTSMPPVDVSIETEDFLPLYPISAYRDDNNLPIEFLCPRSHQYYSNPSESFLYVKARILKEDGKKCESSDAVAVSQMFSMTCIESVHAYLNGTLVNHTANYYPFRAAVENLLSTSTAYQNTVLSPELFYKDDTPNEFDLTKNNGFKQRFELTKESKSFEMCFPLAENVFQQVKCLPPQIELRLKIQRSKPEICLVGKKLGSMKPFPYKIDWESIVLYMKRLQVDLSVVKYHESILKKNHRFNYPIFNHSVRCFSLPKETTNFTEVLSLGKTGNRIVILMTSAAAVNGDIEKASLPFLF